VAFWKLHALAMPNPRSRDSLSPRPFPRSTPAHRRLQVQLELASTRHTLDCGYVLPKCQERIRSYSSLVSRRIDARLQAALGSSRT
jgi:hypothetical protein